MTTGDSAIVVPIYTVTLVTIIREIRDAFRHQKMEQAAVVAHTDLVTRSDQVVATLTDVKTQTNGNTTKLQDALAALLIENGRLQGMVAGLQNARSGARATDAAPASTTVILDGASHDRS
jgi:hypothetical protein